MQLENYGRAGYLERWVLIQGRPTVAYTRVHPSHLTTEQVDEILAENGRLSEALTAVEAYEAVAGSGMAGVAAFLKAQPREVVRLAEIRSGAGAVTGAEKVGVVTVYGGLSDVPADPYLDVAGHNPRMVALAGDTPAAAEA